VISSRPSLATLPGVGLIAAATLAFELILTRVFAVAQFYHFAFMAVSLALLGAGASGSILAAWRRRFPPARLALAFALTIPGAYLLINTLPFDSYTIAYDPMQIVLLAVYFLSLAVPFTLAGLVTGALLEREHVHGIYAANLTGSALGSLLALIGSEVIPAEGLVLGSAALGDSDARPSQARSMMFCSCWVMAQRAWMKETMRCAASRHSSTPATSAMRMRPAPGLMPPDSRASRLPGNTDTLY
jgi:hypothetical protein